MLTSWIKVYGNLESHNVWNVVTLFLIKYIVLGLSKIQKSGGGGNSLILKLTWE